jgi:hypothetical protein
VPSGIRGVEPRNEPPILERRRTEIDAVPGADAGSCGGATGDDRSDEGSVVVIDTDRPAWHPQFARGRIDADQCEEDQQRNDGVANQTPQIDLRRDLSTATFAESRRNPKESRERAA